MKVAAAVTTVVHNGASNDVYTALNNISLSRKCIRSSFSRNLLVNYICKICDDKRKFYKSVPGPSLRH